MPRDLDWWWVKSNSPHSTFGANFIPNLEGDCNLDYEQNVIDVIYNLNNCILEELLNNCECTDLNNDYELNILDIVILVNIILSN